MNWLPRWRGLKGGLSLAMALSMPNLPVNEPIVFITYAIVLFSIIVQGLKIEWVARRNMVDLKDRKSADLLFDIAFTMP